MLESLFNFKLIFATIFAFFVYYFIIKPYLLLQFYKKQGIKTSFFPIIGVYLSDQKNVEKKGDFFYNWKKSAQMEPKPRAVATTLGANVSLILQDTKLIKEFFTHFDRYEKGPIFSFSKKINSSNLVQLEGKEWKKHRKIVSMAFHFNLLKAMVPEIVKITQDSFEKLKNKDLNNVEIMTEFQAITGEVIGSLFFGEAIAGQKINGESVTSYLTKLMKKEGQVALSLGNILLGEKFISLRLFKSHRDYFNNYIEFERFCRGIIEKRMKELQEEKIEEKESYAGKNMVELFYLMKKNSEDILTEKEIVDEFMIFFMAGTDTTSHLIAMATYFLSLNPAIKGKLLEEIERNFKNFDELDYDAINQMEYMTAVLKESLRMATPAPLVVDRIVLNDHMLGDIKLKKGTYINANFIGNHFDDRIHENPEKFDPERWLNPNSLTMKSIGEDPIAFTPFSLGGRNCIGQHMAMMEAKIILGMFLKSFKYENVDANYKLKMGITSLYEPVQELVYRLAVN